MRFVQNRSGTEKRPFRTVSKSLAYALFVAFSEAYKKNLREKRTPSPGLPGCATVRQCEIRAKTELKRGDADSKPCIWTAERFFDDSGYRLLPGRHRISEDLLKTAGVEARIRRAAGRGRILA
jgi:hypothetical protein